MAFSAPVIWEVRTTGSDSNGGGFDPTSGVPGTDFSQQDSPQITYTDMVIGVTTTTFTSVTNSPTASLVGNIINVTSGTGFTVQRVQVLSVAAGVATCDKSLGTTGSTGGNGKMGGALATPGTANGLVVAGNLVYVKNGTYNFSATLTLTAGNVSPIGWVGYSTTRTQTNTDAMPTFSSNNNALSPVVTVGDYLIFRNFLIDGSGSTKAARGILMNGARNCYVDRCKVSVFTDAGMLLQANGVASNCMVTGGTSAATNGAILFASRANLALNCTSDSNATYGFFFNSAGSCAVGCISSNNTGSNGHGFYVGGSDAILVNCVAYNNAQDGLRANGSGDAITVARNCIFEHNVYGINSNTVNQSANSAYYALDYNAFFNNTTAARNQVPVGPNDVTLSSSPFTNAAGNDFSLNNTSGGGAACKAEGFPGALQQGGTGYISIGNLQEQSTPPNVFAVESHTPIVMSRPGIQQY